MGTPMLTVVADCPTVTPRSEARCSVATALLVLLTAFESTTAVEPIVTESVLLALGTPAPNAPAGKLPLMVMVCGLEAVLNVVKAKLKPAGSQVVTPAEHTTPVTLNPAGNVFARLTLVASFGPALVNVRV